MDWATSCGKSLDKESPGSLAGSSPAPQTAPKQDGSLRDKLGPGPGYQIPTGGQQSPVPTDNGGQAAPGGDILAQIMREFAKAIEEGRLKPVVVGPIEIGIPGQAGPAGQTQTPMGDIFGQILRDLLSGKSGQLKPATLADGMGSAVFGDRLELGQSSSKTSSTVCKRCSTVSVEHNVDS